MPYPALIIRGDKLYETRGWSTDYRGPLAIHAARNPRRPLRTDPSTVAMHGRIVAVADLVDCIPTDDADPARKEAALGDWTPGRFAFKLALVRELVPYLPYKSRQGKLINLTDEQIREIESRIGK